jgi:urease accessory protein
VKGVTAAQRERSVLAANRATGRIALTVEASSGETRLARLYEDGPPRVRFPKTPSGRLEAVIVNTAGGMAGGDRLDVAVNAEQRSELVVTTAAAEKVYRSGGDDAVMTARLDVGPAASLFWLPQETILFDQARLTRSIEAELAEDALLLLAEGVVFGRSAMGEAVAGGCFIDRWRVRRAGRLVFAETMRLEGEIAQKLAQPAIANGNVACATILLVPGGEPQVSAVRALEARLHGEMGISAWNGLAAARLCAKDGAALRHDLTAVLTALDACALPRLWLN